jgi:hypothetical protein
MVLRLSGGAALLFAESLSPLFPKTKKKADRQEDFRGENMPWRGMR